MDQSYHVPELLRNSTFLLDTNFFIDSFSNPEVFKDIIFSFKDANIELASISFVKYEFIRSKTIDVVRRKESYFDELVGVVLPFDLPTESQVISIIEQYKQYMEGIPLTDLMLAACLKRYQGLYLLTRDHHDFPTTIFDRIHVFNIESIRDIKTYGVYTYKSEKKVLEEKIPF